MKRKQEVVKQSKEQYLAEVGECSNDPYRVEIAQNLRLLKYVRVAQYAGAALFVLTFGAVFSMPYLLGGFSSFLMLISVAVAILGVGLERELKRRLD